MLEIRSLATGERHHDRCAAEAQQPGPGKRRIVKLCRNLTLQSFYNIPGAPSPHSAPNSRSSLDQGWGERGLGPRNYCFKSWGWLPCIPQRRLEPALLVDADKLCPFATNLGTLAASTGHRLGANDSAAPHLPFADSLTLTPFSPVRAHRLRRDTLTPAGLALPRNIHPRIVPSRSPTAERLPALTFIRGVHPGTRDSVANPKEKRKEDKIEYPSHGSPVPTLLLPLLSQWNKCLS